MSAKANVSNLTGVLDIYSDIAMAGRPGPSELKIATRKVFRCFAYINFELSRLGRVAESLLGSVSVSTREGDKESAHRHDGRGIAADNHCSVPPSPKII